MGTAGAWGVGRPRSRALWGTDPWRALRIRALECQHPQLDAPWRPVWVTEPRVGAPATPALAEGPPPALGPSRCNAPPFRSHCFAFRASNPVNPAFASSGGLTWAGGGGPIFPAPQGELCQARLPPAPTRDPELG